MRKTSLLIIFLYLFSPACMHAQKQDYQVAVIGFYNLENFYDTLDNPHVNDNEFLPGGDRHYNSIIYWDKVHHLAQVISQLGTAFSPDGPALLGVAEIENDTVLHDLVNDPLIQNRQYRVVHYDSRDLRGVDVALLYNPVYFQVEESKKLFVKIPAGSKSSYFTRDVLYVKGKFCGETIHVFVNHWPSRLGGEARSAPARAAAARVNKRMIDSIQQAEPQAKIILMGDLNDDPVSPSLVKVLGAQSDLQKVGPGQLYNPWTTMYKKGIGTLAYQDSWGLFDQILISYPWLSHDQDGFFYSKQFVFNKNFLIETSGKYTGYPKRTWEGNKYNHGYSDHFPTYIVLLKKVKAK